MVHRVGEMRALLENVSQQFGADPSEVQHWEAGVLALDGRLRHWGREQDHRGRPLGEGRGPGQTQV